jgi:YbbR domain-containing protein
MAAGTRSCATSGAGDGPTTLVGLLRDWIRGAFVDNAALKFVAFVLALTVFILVHSDKDAVIGAYIGVYYTMPEDRMLVSEPPDQVRITVKGSWRRIKRFDERELERIHIDLTNVRSGEFLFQKDMVRLPEGLELVAINPASVRLSFEKRAEKSVPVFVPIEGGPDPGFKVERIVTTPSHVAVRGAQSVIEGITRISTRKLSVVGRTGSFRETLPIESPEEFVQIVGRPVVGVYVELVEEMIARDLGLLPVVVRPEGGLGTDAVRRVSTEPAEVRVVLRGPRLALEQLGDAAVAPVVVVRPEDLVAGRQRDIPVVVDNVPRGVGVEIEPRQVAVSRR